MCEQIGKQTSTYNDNEANEEVITQSHVKLGATPTFIISL